jgi:hypothetical protein
MSSSFIGPTGRAFIERFAMFSCQSSISLVKAVEDYNRDFSAYGNEVYALQESRVAHWANFLDQGWFQRRLDLPLLRAHEFDVVLDLGFSVPYAFSLSSLRNSKSTYFLFADREQSCEVFFNALTQLEGWSMAAKRSRLALVDLESEQGRTQISSIVRNRRPRSLLIVASEVLEHLKQTQPIWDWLLNDLASCATERTAVYVTLPIGLRIPSHMMEVRTTEDAVSWVGRHLPQQQSFVISDPRKPKTRYLTAAYCAWAEITPARIQTGPAVTISG